MVACEVTRFKYLSPQEPPLSTQRAGSKAGIATHAQNIYRTLAMLSEAILPAVNPNDRTFVSASF